MDLCVVYTNKDSKNMQQTVNSKKWAIMNGKRIIYTFLLYIL